MRTLMAAGALTLLALGGCATSRYDELANRCEAERRENIALATAAGTALGAAAGAAVDSNDARGAAAGGAIGALIGSQVGRRSSEDCLRYFERYPQPRPGYGYGYGPRY